MTFNDFVVSIYSKSLYQLYKEYGVKDANRFGIGIVVNMRPLPTSYEDIYLNNCFVSAFLSLPISNNISTLHKIIKPFIKDLLAQEALYTTYYLNQIVTFLPKKIFLKLFENKRSPVNISISNIAFSDVAWKINGKEIKSITMNNSIYNEYTGGVMAYTYNGKARFGIQYLNNLKMDSSKLMDNIITNIDQEIASLNKSE